MFFSLHTVASRVKALHVTPAYPVSCLSAKLVLCLSFLARRIWFRSYRQNDLRSRLAHLHMQAFICARAARLELEKLHSRARAMSHPRRRNGQERDAADCKNVHPVTLCPDSSYVYVEYGLIMHLQTFHFLYRIALHLTLALNQIILSL